MIFKKFSKDEELKVEEEYFYDEQKVS